MATKRIQKEFAEFEREPRPGLRVNIVNDTITQWQVFLTGPSESPYKDGEFEISVVFGTDYPFKPPVVKFKTKIYHPNIDEDGSICLEMLKSDVWKPATKVSHVIEAIANLLGQPNTDDPLVASIAETYIKDHPKYIKIAQDYVKKYASKKK